MSNLKKVQKWMKVLQVLSKVILIIIIVGVALSSIAAVLVAADVLNVENEFLHFLSFTTEMSKSQLLYTLTMEAVPLLLNGILAAFAYRYFTAELKEGTPFTDAGADRIRQLGIMEIVFAFLSGCIAGFFHENVSPEEWSSFEDAGSISFGICLILLAMAVRYGAELERKNR